MNLTVLSLATVLLAGPAVAAADDLEDAYKNIQAAQEKKDAAQVKKLAGEIHGMTSEVTATPAPEGADEKEAWTSRVSHAKEIETFAEYALYSTAIQSPPETMVDLLAALEAQNPKSKYMNEGYGSYVAALARTGGAAKVPGIAEKGLANFPENEDLLLLLADNAMTRKQIDRAQVYARRLTAALNKKAKPEGVSAADWERKRTAALGHGYWISGVVSARKEQFAAADKDLRAALPLIKGNAAMLGEALYDLGIANYQLGKLTLSKARVLEGAKFSEQAAAIESPFAQQAQHNANVMKAEAGNMR